MTFEEMKKIVVDTLNCEEDKVTMEASLTEDLEADSLDAVELNMSCRGKMDTISHVALVEKPSCKIFARRHFRSFQRIGFTV